MRAALARGLVLLRAVMNGPAGRVADRTKAKLSGKVCYSNFE